jgi:hypothetical protein
MKVILFYFIFFKYMKTSMQVHLLPLLEAEAKRLLKQRAQEGVVREAARALRRVVETGECVGRGAWVGWWVGVVGGCDCGRRAARALKRVVETGDCVSVGWLVCVFGYYGKVEH